MTDVEKKGISGSTLKWIALVTMLTDHIGAVVVVRAYMHAGIWPMVAGGNLELLSEEGLLGWYLLYMLMRHVIGRVAFPIYCYLLVEGFLHTRSVTKYALRMALFAIVSEVPFDLALTGRLVHTEWQNVYFTLLIGLLVMAAFRAIENSGLPELLKMALCAAAFVAGIFVSMKLKTDYGSYGIGVICIMALYIFRHRKKEQILAGCVTFAWEITAPLGFIPVAFYNGKRGHQMKYLFYFFYPMHFLLLYLLCVSLGLA